MRGAVDEAVDALVDLDQAASGRLDADGVQLVEEGLHLDPVAVGQSLGGELGGERLEDAADLRERGEVAGVSGRHEHAAAGVDLDELGLGQGPQRLADGGAAEAEALHELALVDQAARGQLQGDDQLAQRVVRLLGLRAGVRLQDLDRRGHRKDISIRGVLCIPLLTPLVPQ